MYSNLLSWCKERKLRGRTETQLEVQGGKNVERTVSLITSHIGNIPGLLSWLSPQHGHRVKSQSSFAHKWSQQEFNE